MFGKQSFKDFLDFKVLISEKFMKYIFIALSALSILGTVGFILFSWYGAFTIIRYSFKTFLWLFLGMPILSILGLVVSLILMRMGFEIVMLLFLIYRELKQKN